MKDTSVDSHTHCLPWPHVPSLPPTPWPHLPRIILCHAGKNTGPQELLLPLVHRAVSSLLAMRSWRECMVAARVGARGGRGLLSCHVWY